MTFSRSSSSWTTRVRASCQRSGGAVACGMGARCGRKCSPIPTCIARLFLEQVREAGVVQMADRIRAVWNPKLIVLATDVPVDLTPTCSCAKASCGAS